MNRLTNDRLLIHGRHPPSNKEFENAIICAMIIDASCIDDVVQIVNKDSFFQLEHQIIFASSKNRAL